MLKGKIAVVTGGSRGIGAAIAYKLASLGADIAVIYAGNNKAAEDVCNKCRQDYDTNARAYQCDVSDFTAVKETVAEIKKDFGTVHILVNNAGITRDGLCAMMKEEDFDSVINVNLKGSFNCAKHASSIMLRQKSGKIINISSVIGIIGNAGQVNYAASKAGIIGMTKSLAKELGSRGINVNAIAPGFIETDMTDVLGDNVKETILSHIPLKKMGKTEDVSNLAVFLASSMSDYITGQVITVDGGMVM